MQEYKHPSNDNMSVSIRVPSPKKRLGPCILNVAENSVKSSLRNTSQFILNEEVMTVARIIIF